MSNTAFVKPVEGAMVRYPGGSRAILPAAGAEVPMSGSEGTYWRRRINDGTVVLSTPLTEQPIPAEQKSTTAAEPTGKSQTRRN